MIPEQDDIEMDAADWHARILAGEADWTVFALWLDAHPDHQPAYDRIALLDAQVVEWVRQNGMPEGQSEGEAPSPGATRRWWLGGAVAASLTALAIGLPDLMGSRPSPLVVHATGRDRQTIALPGNSGQVLLDRNSQLALGQEGHVQFDKGAAYFDVRQVSRERLQIKAGEFLVRDIGTRFTVTRDKGRLFVAVEQGLVDISWRGRGATRLAVGQAFEGDETTGMGETSSIDPANVGSWREGRLVYSETPLATVAADLSRAAGTQVEVDPAVANLKLSGVLLIRDGTDLADQISAILPVEVRRDDGRIRLVARGKH